MLTKRHVHINIVLLLLTIGSGCSFFYYDATGFLLNLPVPLLFLPLCPILLAYSIWLLWRLWRRRKERCSVRILYSIPPSVAIIMILFFFLIGPAFSSVERKPRLRFSMSWLSNNLAFYQAVHSSFPAHDKGGIYALHELCGSWGRKTVPLWQWDAEQAKATNLRVVYLNEALEGLDGSRMPVIIVVSQFEERPKWLSAISQRRRFYAIDSNCYFYELEYKDGSRGSPHELVGCSIAEVIVKCQIMSVQTPVNFPSFDGMETPEIVKSSQRHP